MNNFDQKRDSEKSLSRKYHHGDVKLNSKNVSAGKRANPQIE